jgi:glycerophosphoryl diester phosphodiesterase
MPPHARTPYLDHDGPLVMAHRGFDPGGDGRLENSMKAFAAAVDLGARYLETDVHATSDGRLLAFHDSALDRVTDHKGRVAQMPWSHVSRALIGGTEPIPLLEDVLGAWPDVRVNVDVKSSGAIAPLVEVLERTCAHGRVCIASFSDQRRRATVGRLSRPVATSPGVAGAARFWVAVRLGAPAGVLRRLTAAVDCLQMPVRLGRVHVVTPRFVAAAHDAGLQVHVWTVNDPAEMRRLLDLGVDGLITDRTDLAVQEVRRRPRGPS